MRYWTPFSGFLQGGTKDRLSPGSLAPSRLALQFHRYSRCPSQTLETPISLSCCTPSLQHGEAQNCPDPAPRAGKTGPATGAWPWLLEQGPSPTALHCLRHWSHIEPAPAHPALCSRTGMGSAKSPINYRPDLSLAPAGKGQCSSVPWEHGGAGQS